MSIEIAPSAWRVESARVAVITRTKNRAVMLQRAMRSVLNQTFPDWVHVVVNDGGDLAPVCEMASQYADAYDGRLLLLHRKVSTGMEAASNAGIAASTSEFLLIHDDDDSLLPSFLQRTVDYLDQADCAELAGVTTLSTRVDEQVVDGRLVEQKSSVYRDIHGAIALGDMAVVNQFPPISFLYRRHVLEVIGLYDERLPVLGDWDFNLRFLLRFDIGVLPEALANYHLRATSSDAALGNSLHAQQNRHLVYDTMLRNRFLRSEEGTQRNVGLLMALAKFKPSAPNRRRLFDPLYALPGFTAAVRWLRQRGYLLQLTRNL